MTDIDRIIKFFLHIFQLQSGVSGELEGLGEYRMVSSDTDSALIYELRIKLFSGWKSRRMSLRQLGESVESKSTCYVVTYDDLLVIKIPPSPLADFNKYLANINNEHNISQQLSPAIHCLSPSLSSILNRVPELVDKISKEETDVEAAYVSLLTKEPRYQGFLKIGDRFAFFMSLSKHPFFDQIIKKIHGDKKWIQNEIYKNSRCVVSLEEFETVYGSQEVDLYFNINDLYKDFSRNIDALASADEGMPSIPEYQKQEWLFAGLAGKPPGFNADELSQKKCDAIKQLLSQAIDKKRAWVDEYRKTAIAYIQKRNLAKNRSKIEALVINTLELIYKLETSGASIRDLKPDNILVMEKAVEVQSQEEHAITTTLGLIDLETAVKIDHLEPEKIPQPMLAGTPSYMTPSQMFRNKELTAVFGKEIRRIFYLQDWFAAIGIIFNIVTGKFLFHKTAALIPEINRVQKKGLKQKIPMTEIFSYASKIFWKTASEELDEKISSNYQALQNVRLTLPDYIIDLFKTELETEKTMLLGLIEKCAHSQKILSKNAQKFIDATYDTICDQRIKWEKENVKTTISQEVRDQIITQLTLLENLKLNLSYKNQDVLLQKNMIACDELIFFLFRRILNAMNWPAQACAHS